MTQQDDRTIDRRWQLVLPHRQSLLRFGYSRGVRESDAEACAHEAMLRCVQHPDLDETRVLPFLITTMAHLCVDQARAGARDERIAAKLTSWHVAAPSPEEEVCDRDEARWVAQTLVDLPQRQRLVLAARMEGLSGAEIADRLGMSYKAVESLLGRLRRDVRAALVGAVGALLGLLRRPRATTAITASSVALFVVTSLVLGTKAPQERVLHDQGRPDRLALAPRLPVAQIPTTPSPYAVAAGPVPRPTSTPRRSFPPGLLPPSIVPTSDTCAWGPDSLICVVLTMNPTPLPERAMDCVRYGPDPWHAGCNSSPSPDTSSDRKSP